MTPAERGQHNRNLHQIAATLRSDEAYPVELRQSAIDLYDLLSKVSGFQVTDFQPADDQETILPFGKALSPIDAARCTANYHRTAMYVRGLEAAIREARKRFPGEVVHVLYAGCGPFAPLAVVQTAHFSPEEVVFTLLDIHPRSLEVVKTIIEGLDLTDYVRHYALSDATMFKSDADSGAHVVVIELMQRALENEPHVAATINLVSQLKDGGFFVPEFVRLTACLANLSKEFQLYAPDDQIAHAPFAASRDRVMLGSVLELDAARALEFGDVFNGSASTLPPVTIRVPPHDVDRYTLTIMTEVTVFGDHVLRDYDSGITRPRSLYDLDGVSRGAFVDFTYHISEKPGLRYRVR